MRYCTMCGSELSGEGVCCMRCANANAVVAGSGKLNTGMLVWAIANIFLFSRLFGILALVFTALAQGETTREKEQAKIKIALICNIIACAAVCIALIICFIIFWVSGISLIALIPGLIAQISLA